MIYQCQDDIKQLLNRRVLPLMKQRTQAALAESGLNNSAVIAYAQDIFTAHHYSNMKDLRFPPENPLGELDFTAFWFLLFPYDKGDDATAQAEGTPQGGAMDCLRQYLGLPDQVVLKLFRLRSLRNKLEHNTPYFYCLLPEHRKLFHIDENDIFRYQYPERQAWEGQQILHDDALAIIADTIAPLDPGIYQAAAICAQRDVRA